METDSQCDLLNQTATKRTWGRSTLRWTVSGETQNSSGPSGNLKILPGIGRLGNFFGRHARSNKVKISGVSRYFGDLSPNFRQNFCLHMFLLKPRLLELSLRIPLKLKALSSAYSSFRQKKSAKRSNQRTPKVRSRTSV